MTLSRARQNEIANQKAISTDQVGQPDTSGTGNLDLVSEQYDDVLTEDIGLGADDRPEVSGDDIVTRTPPVELSSTNANPDAVENKALLYYYDDGEHDPSLRAKLADDSIEHLGTAALDARVTALEGAPAPSGGGDVNQMLFFIGTGATQGDLNFGTGEIPTLTPLTSMMLPGYSDPAWASHSGGGILFAEEGLYNLAIPQLTLKNLTDDEKFQVTVFCSQNGQDLAASYRIASIIPGVNSGQLCVSPTLLLSITDTTHRIDIKVNTITSGPDLAYQVQSNCIAVLSKLA